MKFTPPVRFVLTILTLWIGLRFIFWSPADLPERLFQSPNPFLPGLPVLPLYDRFSGSDRAFHAPLTATTRDHYQQPAEIELAGPFTAPSEHHMQGCGARCMRILLTAHISPFSQPIPVRFARRHSQTPPPGPMTSFTNSQLAPRFSLSAWAQWRSGDGADALANDGELGGSQAGVRARYRIMRAAGIEAALSARLSRPLERRNGTEAAIGIAIRPFRRIPVELTAERRIGLDNGGRDAWSLGVAGGLYRQPLPLGFEFDGYAQAGIVGAQRRDLYGDAAFVVSQPVPLSKHSTLSLGGGVWAGAQPGVSRIDIGPEASVRLPAGDGGVRFSLSWRQRIAGSAAPGSGPVLTLGTNF